MAELTFYTNPQSRGRIVRWMLEEVGQSYDTEVIDYADLKSDRYRAVNPDGQGPGDQTRGQVVTECAAICAYLADVFPDAGSGPPRRREGRLLSLDVLRGGPAGGGGVEQGDGLGTDARARADVRLRHVRSDHRVSTAFSDRDYVCGDRFTAADVYVGSQLMFPMQFGLIDKRDSFARYAERLQEP